MFFCFGSVFFRLRFYDANGYLRAGTQDNPSGRSIETMLMSKIGRMPSSGGQQRVERTGATQGHE